MIKRITPVNSKTSGPYFPSVEVTGNGISQLYISGQGTTDPKTGQRFLGAIKEQAEIAMDNLKSVIEGSGYSMNNVVKVTLFITDMSDSNIVNEVYKKYFSEENYPARSIVGVKELPGGQKIEVEAIAVKKS